MWEKSNRRILWSLEHDVPTYINIVFMRFSMRTMRIKETRYHLTLGKTDKSMAFGESSRWGE